MKYLIAVITLSLPGFTIDLSADQPIQYSDLEKAGFGLKDFSKLKDEQKSAFYRVYPPDREMLDRVKLGTITKNPIAECIAGEPPTLAEAREKFPPYYPRIGRIRQVTGMFEWQGKKLFFRTEKQLYEVEEHHIVYRLKQLGLKEKSEPRKATLDAVWLVNKIDGLRFVYMQKVKLADE